jgi:hypothetical protein
MSPVTVAQYKRIVVVVMVVVVVVVVLVGCKVAPALVNLLPRASSPTEHGITARRHHARTLAGGWPRMTAMGLNLGVQRRSIRGGVAQLRLTPTLHAR